MRGKKTKERSTTNGNHRLRVVGLPDTDPAPSASQPSAHRVRFQTAIESRSPEGMSVDVCDSNGRLFFTDSAWSITRLIGDLNSAMPGDTVIYSREDGCPIQFAAHAITAGVGGIITDQSLSCPIPQYVVHDVDAAVDRAAAAMLNRPWREIYTVAVIGGAGKTTTALLVATMMRGVGYRVAYRTDLGSSDGVTQHVDNTIENGSAALQNWMADAIDANCDVALVELDESNIHSDSLIGGIDMLVIAPGSSNTDAVESFGPDKIHAGLDAMHPEGVAVVCGDCVKTHRQVLNSGRRLLSYGMRKRSDVSAKIFDQQPGITTLVVHAGDTSAMMETQLTGGQMAVCQLAAISVGLLLEQTLPDAIQQVSRLQQVPGRLQCLRSEYGKARVVLDAAADGNSLSGVLRDMRREKGTGRLWCVAGLGTTDGNTLARIGNALERFADNVVLTTGDIPSASFLAASHGVMDGVKECALMRLVADRETAIRWVLDHAGKNDTVLILGGIGGQTPAQRRAKINATQSIFAEQSSRQPQPIY